jgi:hypothetical protein
MVNTLPLETARESEAMEAARLLKEYRDVILSEFSTTEGPIGKWGEVLDRIDACLRRLEEVS